MTVDNHLGLGTRGSSKCCGACCSVTQLCLIPCDPMSCSVPGSPVLHCLLEFAQTLESSHLILCRPLLFLPSIFPSIRVFLVSPLFTSGGQSIGVSALASVLPVNIQSWFPFGLTGLISLQSKVLSRVFSSTTSPVPKTSLLQHSAFFMIQISHPYITTGKTIALSIRTFVGKVMSVLFNMLSSFVIAFLPRSKRLLISWLQSLSTVILEPKKIKFVTVSTFSPIYLPWSDGTGCHDLSFLNVEF